MKLDWKKTLSVIAPTLAGALGGPLAGTAASAIMTKLFGESAFDESKVSSVISNASPEILLKLKEAEFEFVTKITELGLEVDRIAAADRASARERDASTRDWLTKALAIGVFSLFGGSLLALIYIPIPAPNKDAIMQSIGVLYASVTAVLAFYFGSSVGSKNKDTTIDRTLNGR